MLLKAEYPAAPKIHVVLDQSGYHTSQALKEWAVVRGIDLHYLPPYGPNLNPIERLCKGDERTSAKQRIF
jgi:transposase